MRAILINKENDREIEVDDVRDFIDYINTNKYKLLNIEFEDYDYSTQQIILKEIDEDNKYYEEICLEILKKDGEAISYIKRPTEEMKIEAINEYPDIIGKIDNPNEKLQLMAIEKDIFSFTKIKNPTIKVQLKTIERKWDYIQFILKPDIEVQLMAVKKHYDSIRYINNPSEEAILLHLQLWGIGNVLRQNFKTKKIMIVALATINNKKDDEFYKEVLKTKSAVEIKEMLWKELK